MDKKCIRYLSAENIAVIFASPAKQRKLTEL